MLDMVGSLVQDDGAIDWASGVYALKERECEDWVQAIEGWMQVIEDLIAELKGMPRGYGGYGSGGAVDEERGYEAKEDGRMDGEEGRR